MILGPRARGWGLFGAYFSPIRLLKMTWIAPNLVYLTILDWWRPLGAIWGHLGPFGAIWGLFLSDFRAQSKRLGPVWRIFFTHLATQNDLNGSILVQWDRGITILDWWRPLGAILGHFGLILELRARGWGLFGAYFSPIWLDKMTWMALNLVQWDKVLPHLTGGGHCRPFWSDFEPFWVA